MTRKDKRSLLLSLVIGDGCLHYIRSGKKKYGAITIAHSTAQADYIAWKAGLIGSILGRQVNLRKTPNQQGYKNASELIQISTSWIRFKAWRKFVYPNGKKDKSRILRFITNPDFLIAVWLMDDGYVEGKIDKKYQKCYNANLRIFICDQSPESCEKIKRWIEDQYGFEIKLKFTTKDGKKYPFLKLGTAGSEKIWKQIREFVLQFKSMQHKFRFLEMRYQHKLLIAHHTRKSDDIVSTT
jgi:hypothetical protein